MKVVISQPMFIPWIGLFEQIRLADIYVHYDDVQLPNGRSFIYRVQIKMKDGIKWLSAPVERKSRTQLINQSYFSRTSSWQKQHLTKLHHSYCNAPFYEKMFNIAKSIYNLNTFNVAEFNIQTIEYISNWLGLKTHFLRSSSLNIGGKSTERLVAICNKLKADTYITGHGAKNYLNYSLFEEKSIDVKFMAYKKQQYNQLHGEFSPYVSILDAIANCGEKTSALLCSSALPWKEFLNATNFRI
jgi:hypothetical protein